MFTASRLLASRGLCSLSTGLASIRPFAFPEAASPLRGRLVRARAAIARTTAAMAFDGHPLLSLMTSSSSAAFAAANKTSAFFLLRLSFWSHFSHQQIKKVSNKMASSDCLLARAIPLPAAKSSNKAISDDADAGVDALADQLKAAVSLGSSPADASAKKAEKPSAEAKERRKRLEEEVVSPADHLALQSLRSSALARKTNTTAKFSRDCRNLFADLLLDEKEAAQGEKQAKSKVEKEEHAEDEDKKNEKEGIEETKPKEQQSTKEGSEEDKSGELIARGPIRSNFVVHAAQPYHPYTAAGPMESPHHHQLPFNAAAPQSVLLDQSSLNPAAYGYGYECGLPASNWSSSGWSGRDSVLSSPSSTPDSTYMMAGSGGGHHHLMNQMLMSPGGRSERSELPDDLSDFILEYSRRYSPVLSRKASLGSDGGSPRSTVCGDSPCAGGGGESPLSAPQSSPAAPRGGSINGTATPTAKMMTMTKQGSTELLGGGARPAKDRLRGMIRGEDMDEAFAWTCKCIKRHPGALTFQDADRDTLLHIVTSHMDLAKIYALVEQMLKSEQLQQQDRSLPFDMPNGMGETPLMMAVQKRHAEVVAYLLEAGANPNAQSSRLERDMPLHYAATRGMTAVVQALSADQRTNLDAQNGMGLTPLLCAFKSHGMLEEESKKPVSNLEVAKVLLQAGADPQLADATNGRTLAHFAVERMDEKLIELLSTHLDDQQLNQLVNRVDFCGETPMRTLEGLGDEAKRSRLCLALITCGADACE